MRNILYHNPRWRKSREAVLLLEQNNIEFELIEYLKNPLSLSDILLLSKRLEKRPKEFVRMNDNAFKKNTIVEHLDDDKEMAFYISQYPSIMERPIFVKNDKAVIGRPLDNIKKLLEE